MMGIKRLEITEQIGQSSVEQSALRMPALFCPTCPERKKFQRGQQALEYGIFVFAISLALLTMYVYTKRGLQAAIKTSADQIGPQIDSIPFAGSVETNSISQLRTLTSDTMEVNKIGQERFYEFDSVSTSSGNATTVTTAY